MVAGSWTDSLGRTPATRPLGSPGVPATQAKKSTVFVVRFKRSGYLLRPVGIQRRRLKDMIISGMCELARCADFPTAMKTFFRPDDVIGFKFDYTAEHVLRTNQAVCEELLRLFHEHGFPPQQLMFIGATPADESLPKTPRPPFGWTEPVDFGSGQDALAVVLDKVTALVNVPVLKADPIMGIGGCLKNITYGFVRHPARFYANGCSPYVADIYNLPRIRSKIRFNMVNAIKVLIRHDVIDGPDGVVPHETLLFSSDPVAADAYGLIEVVERFRKDAALPPLVQGKEFPPHLLVAAQKNIGRYHPDHVERKYILL